MKKLFALLAISAVALSSVKAIAQDDKSKRPSPPAKVSQKINSGATITIDYSQPAVKGRTIGKDLEPMTGKVWRTGANEATVFETDKAVTVEGKSLPAGKYAFFTKMNADNTWTLIFNKVWKTWGAFDYESKNKDQDALQVNVKSAKASPFAERLTFNVDKSGKVSFVWGDYLVAFNVK
ncbi:DUF2911 domain-containing protein [Danxiaibacter flavus]|uniref:DUF2911 domain-containing protein n=1 Tax=Danxiaibacter flavus TaxID=3049108 RepID=A0ABV3ZHS0_9BACT|nr:DUF2911 domain-containing protein [Chitinophagaceae bacterium DXS]